MELVQTGCDDRSQDAPHRPAQLPVIFEASVHHDGTVSPGGAKGTENEPAENRVTGEVAGLPQNVMNQLESSHVRRRACEEGPDLQKDDPSVIAGSEVRGFDCKHPQPQ